MMKAFDANDWIYQGWAYERRDVGGAGAKDLLNPDFEPKISSQRKRRRISPTSGSSRSIRAQ